MLPGDKLLIKKLLRQTSFNQAELLIQLNTDE